MPTVEEPDFRWRGSLQRSADALFVLNRQRRMLFVNSAWEALTGVKFAEVRGRACKRRARENLAEGVESVLSALAPPRTVLQGKSGQARRRVLLPLRGLTWWDVSYFPWNGPDGLLGLLGKIQPVPEAGYLKRQPLPEKIVQIRERFAHSFTLASMPAEATAMQRVLAQARLASATTAAVLLTGPAGTGKRWLARAIHQESASREKFFLCVDAAHAPPAAVADILFGPAGIERLEIGTLYLREPAGLPRELQARLVEVLQAEHDAWPRLIAGFRRDPRTETSAGRLLPELHDLLGTLTISLPPLAERMADLPWWVERLLGRACEAVGKKSGTAAGSQEGVRGVTPAALEVLQAHRWPENLTELDRVLRSACQHTLADRIDVSDLPLYLRTPSPPPDRHLPLDQLLEQVERRLMTLALGLAQNNKSKAAALLAIWRPRLVRRLEALGIADGKKEQG